MNTPQNETVIWFENLTRGDVPKVGGKNASLGEMVSNLGGQGVAVPSGFATSADAYWRFIEANNIRDKLAAALDDLAANKMTLAEAGQHIRRTFLQGDFPEDIARDITAAYKELCSRSNVSELDVAVRSSATAEDLPDASFAGQQETFLNIRGDAQLLDACPLLRLPVYRSRNQLQAGQGLRSSESGAVGRRSAHGPFR